MLFFFFLLMRRPPRSTLFPTRRSSDLTTRAGLLATPLRDRFGIPIRLEFYTHEELQQVLLGAAVRMRSEEHTSELQSQSNLVCRLLLEKKKRLNMSSSGRLLQYSGGGG